MKSLLAILLASTVTWAASPSLQEGDLVFQTSRSAQSLAIQQATHSPYSHMGVILHRGGRPFVFEAVATVRFTPLDAWIQRGEKGAWVAKRLKTPLRPGQMATLRRLAQSWQGSAYDLAFEWSDRRFYCSELVWKLYQRAAGLEIGALQPLKTFQLDAPAVGPILKQRYGQAIPLEEPVISPAAMLDSPLLEPVNAR